MPETSAVVEDKAVPPVAVVYHLILVPVATKLATVEPEHKVCVALPVGAGVVEFTVIVMFFLQVTPFVVTSTQY